MPISALMSVRALKVVKTLTLYLSGKLPRGWFAEQLAAVNGSDLSGLVTDLDKEAAVLQTSNIRQEHTDLFCLKRDLAYATRSRRWLYSRAMVSRMDSQYEIWLGTVRENMDAPLQTILDTDPDLMVTQTPKQLLNLPS